MSLERLYCLVLLLICFKWPWKVEGFLWVLHSAYKGLPQGALRTAPVAFTSQSWAVRSGAGRRASFAPSRILAHLPVRLKVQCAECVLSGVWTACLGWRWTCFLFLCLWCPFGLSSSSSERPTSPFGKWYPQAQSAFPLWPTAVSYARISSCRE